MIYYVDRHIALFWLAGVQGTFGFFKSSWILKE